MKERVDVVAAVAAGGQNAGQLRQQRCYHKPTWSSDGRWIAFSADVEASTFDQRVDILRIHPDGTDVTNVTAAKGQEFYPHWNPAWTNDVDP